MQLAELEQKLNSRQDAERILAEFCQYSEQQYQPDELTKLLEQLEAQQEELSISVNESNEHRMLMRQELEQIKQQIQTLTQKHLFG